MLWITQVTITVSLWSLIFSEMFDCSETKKKVCGEREISQLSKTLLEKSFTMPDLLGCSCTEEITKNLLRLQMKGGTCRWKRNTPWTSPTAEFNATRTGVHSVDRWPVISLCEMASLPQREWPEITCSPWQLNNPLYAQDLGSLATHTAWWDHP